MQMNFCVSGPFFRSYPKMAYSTLDTRAVEEEQVDDNLPRFSYDLIEWLDQIVHRPEAPTTANGWAALNESALRQAAFTAGARSLVDQLLALREEDVNAEEVTEPTADVPDDTSPVFPKLFDTAGELREITSPVRMARSLPEHMLDL